MYDATDGHGDAAPDRDAHITGNPIQHRDQDDRKERSEHEALYGPLSQKGPETH